MQSKTLHDLLVQGFSDHLRSMTTNDSTRNFLLQITLLKTSSPVVTRLLSVQPTVTFLGLSHAIEASFGWSPENTIDQTGKFPTFVVVNRKPFEAKEEILTDCLLELVPDGHGGDVNGEDDTYYPTQALVKVREIFQNFRFRDRLIEYDYDVGFTHVIQMLGCSANHTDGSIECLGGQGRTTQRTWNQGRTGPHEISHGGPSTLDLDLDEVRSRLREVESKRLKHASGLGGTE